MLLFLLFLSLFVFTVFVLLWSRFFNAYYFSLILLSCLVFTIKEEIGNGSVRGGLGILGSVGWVGEKAAGL